MSKNLIAIVDDEKEILNTYSQILKPLGEIVCFESPKQFVVRFQKEKEFRPDLLLMDYAMPGMSGVEMLQKVRESGANFPTILISGQLDKKVMMNAANIGMCLVMEKPVRGKALLAASNQILLVHSIAKARAEIGKAVTELVEIYTVLKDMLMTAAQPDSEEMDGSSLEQALETVETRLQSLRGTEKTLEKMQRQSMEEALETAA